MENHENALGPIDDSYEDIIKNLRGLAFMSRSAISGSRAELCLEYDGSGLGFRSYACDYEAYQPLVSAGLQEFKEGFQRCQAAY